MSQRRTTENENAEEIAGHADDEDRQTNVFVNDRFGQMLIGIVGRCGSVSERLIQWLTKSSRKIEDRLGRWRQIQQVKIDRRAIQFHRPK